MRKSLAGIGVVLCLAAGFLFLLKVGTKTRAGKQLEASSATSNPSLRPSSPAKIGQLAPPSSGNFARIVQKYEQLPLAFEPNQGQAREPAQFVARGGDYSATDDCLKASLQPGTNCTILVRFTPSTVGSSVGALTLTDDAPDSPQIVYPTGTGVSQSTPPPTTGDFTSAAQPLSATISAGQSAQFAASITGSGGFSQAVSRELLGTAESGDSGKHGDGDDRDNSEDDCAAGRQRPDRAPGRHPHSERVLDPAAGGHAVGGRHQARIAATLRPGGFGLGACRNARRALDGLRRRHQDGRHGRDSSGELSSRHRGNFQLARAYGDGHFAGEIGDADA
jgi:hypothetical protein